MQFETAQRYERWSAPFRKKPKWARALLIANKLLTAIGYAAYPALLVGLFLLAPNKVLECLLVPALSFIVVSVFRAYYNAPRPYQVLDIHPLISKETQGRSFPSRHTFCMFMIACSWLLLCAPVAIVLFVCGAIMGVIRIIGGIHFPKDVIFGVVLALLFSYMGYELIPSLWVM